MQFNPSAARVRRRALVRQGDLRIARRQIGSGFFTPLAHSDAVGAEEIAKSRLVEFNGAFKAIKIKVMELDSVQNVVVFDELKRRTAYAPRHAERAQQRTRKGRLAGAQVARKTKIKSMGTDGRRMRFKRAGKLLRQTHGGGFVDKFQRGNFVVQMHGASVPNTTA